MRVITACILLVAMLSLGSFVSADAGPSAVDEMKIRAMVKDLGQPARRKRVAAWLERSDEDPAGTGALVALALGRCGGPEAVLGLLRLDKVHKDRIVEATLMSAVGVGFRWPLLEKPAVRTLMYSRDVGLRVLALQVLGRIGDGRHMPILLAAAATTDPQTKEAALFSMRLLSGVKLPGRTSRWELWWQQAEIKGRRDLRLALDQLEAGASAAKAPLWRSVVHRTGWIDIKHARHTAATWLQGEDAHLHLEAAHLIRHLRLADLGSRLEQVAQRMTRSAARTAMEDVLVSLGHRPRARVTADAGAAGR